MTRWERLAPQSGIVAVIALVGSTLFIGFYEYVPASETIRDPLMDTPTNVPIGADLGMFGAVALLWFAGSVRAMLRTAEGGTGRVSAIAFGGGVATGTLMIGAYSAMLASSVRAGADGGISGEAATILYDLASTIQGVGMAYAMAAFVGGFAVVAFRTGVAARWLAWVSAVIAIGLVTPVSYAVLGFGFLWVAYVSALAYTEGRRAGATSASHPM